MRKFACSLLVCHQQVVCGHDTATAAQVGAQRSRLSQHRQDTTSQPQKSGCQQNSTAPVGPSWRRLAVGPTTPADWGTRSTRSHLGKCPEHEVLIFADRGVGLGVHPVQGQVSPKRAGGQGGLGSSRFLAGFRSAAGAPATAKRRPKRLARIQCGDHCRALALLLRRSHQSPCSG
jgi:hypothetical protein